MSKDEAMKLALDDLMAEYCMERTSFARRVDEIFKQVFAAPAQEFVCSTGLCHYRKPLSDDQRHDIYSKCQGLDVLKAISLTEAAHGIKELNT